ncbi:ATP-binding protein [Herbidospora mongoliensis]|uniref:ATP-binding protein n=1 Tax=Herbidospora mongoliensis TaxID=688067 RepID=UPI00082C4264|nr:ATP-binding protein [Herbidospora mongoliensis]
MRSWAREWLPSVFFVGFLLVTGFLDGLRNDKWYGAGLKFTLASLIIVSIAVQNRSPGKALRRMLPKIPRLPTPRRIPLLPLWETPKYGKTLLEPVSCPVPFVGREEELARLGTWLDDPDAFPLMVVAGPPGVGKSRLMVEFARTREGKWRCGRLGPGPSRGLIKMPASDKRPALILVDEADLRDDIPLLLAELRDHPGKPPIRVIAEARHPGGLESHYGPVIRLHDPDDLDVCFELAVEEFGGEVADDVPTPAGPVFNVLDAARLTARKHAVDLLDRERRRWAALGGGDFGESAVVANLLAGGGPDVLRRIPELRDRPDDDIARMSAWEPIRPVLLATRLLSEVATARPGIIDAVTQDLSWAQARRALWWLGCVADGSPEAAAAFLRLAVAHDGLLPRAVCCLVGDGLAEPLAALVVTREWTADELAAVDSPDLPAAVRSALSTLT